MSISSSPQLRAGELTVLGVSDPIFMLNNLLRSVPRNQFMRELPYNGLQACQRAMAAGAESGIVRIDYVRRRGSDGRPVAKLRIFDTGDGMSPQTMVDRLNNISVVSDTGDNFGIGAKVAAAKVSPYGVIYQSLRDGQASMVRLERNTAGEWGLWPFNPDASDPVSRSVLSLPLEHLPQEIRDAGHGTAVTLLGEGPDDITTWTLRPERSESKRWALEYLNARFTEIPDGIEMRVVIPDYKPDPKTGELVDESRRVRGSAAFLKDDTRDRRNSDDPKLGARGTIRIKGPVPATAYWWLLPETKNPNTIMGIGGKVRVVLNHEAYVTEGIPYLNEAGIWREGRRVEIHFVPDGDAGVFANLERTTLQVDGNSLPLREWCREFRNQMPKALANMLAQGANRTSRRSWENGMADMWTLLRGAGRRSNRGRSLGAATGSPDLFDVTRGHGSAGPRSHDAAGPDRTRSAAPGTHRSATCPTGQQLAPATAPHSSGAPAAAGRTESTSTGETVAMTGTGRRVRAVPAPPALPTVVWVNDGPQTDDPELANRAGRFIVSDNRLILNAAFPTYANVVTAWVSAYAHVPGSEGRIRSQCQEYWESLLVDSVLGIIRDLPPAETEALLTPEGLTVAAAGCYHTFNRLKQVFGKVFRESPNGALALLGVTDAGDDLGEELEGSAA